MFLTDFLGLFKQGKVSAHSHMKNLIEIAMADGHYDAIENDLLQKLASKHGVSKKKLEDIRNNKVEVEFIVPEEPKEKFSQLYELVRMMVVDKHIDNEELRLCNVFAKRFGFNPDRTQELIDSIISNIKNGQSIEETLKRVSWIIK